MTAGDDFLYCDVGERRFAFRSRDVRHVERSEYLKADASNDGRAGVLMLGDRAVSVFSLGSALGLPRERASGTAGGHIAVTGDRHNLIGWLIDRVARADHSRGFHVAPIPSLIGTPACKWFEGAIRMDERHSALLIRPQCLNPLEPCEPPSAAIAPPAAAASPQWFTSTTPMAMAFTTSALPPSAARRYALSGRQIAAIVRAEPWLDARGCATHIAGLMWWRDAIVPMIDFRPAQDRHDDDTHRRCLIVRCGPRHRRALVGLPISADVLMCGTDGRHRELTDMPNPWFASGIFDINGDATALVDLDALVEGDASGARHDDAVLPDFLVQRAARDAEALRRAFDPPPFGA